MKGAYAALVNNVYQAQRAELSNHANIITLGSAGHRAPSWRNASWRLISMEEFDPQSRSAPKVRRICEYENGID